MLVPRFGGFKGDRMNPIANTWYYDPKKQTLKPGPSMIYPRRRALLTLLRDGRILITGGWSPDPFTMVAHAEVFDPTKGTFTALSDMYVPRCRHNAVQLSSGDVLVVGGQTSKSLSDSGYTMTATAEILDIKSGKFVLIGQLHNARQDATVVALPNNQAFVCGGESDEIESIHHNSEPVLEPEIYEGKYKALEPTK
jgi:hypothetical protein